MSNKFAEKFNNFIIQQKCLYNDKIPVQNNPLLDSKIFNFTYFLMRLSEELF